MREGQVLLLKKTFATDVNRKIQKHTTLSNFNVQCRMSLLFVIIPNRRSYFRSSVGSLSKIEGFYTTYMAGYEKSVQCLLFTHPSSLSKNGVDRKLNVSKIENTT